jgi:hypothetical protein
MPITPAAVPTTYYAPLVKQGCFDNDIMSQVNALQAANDVLVALLNTSLGFAVFNTGAAATLLPATAPAGTYVIGIYGVLTTAFATNTNWVVTLGWTDDQQAQTLALINSATLTQGTFVQTTAIIRSNGTAAITYTPSKTGSAATAGVVALSLTVQRIL